MRIQKINNTTDRCTIRPMETQKFLSRQSNNFSYSQPAFEGKYKYAKALGGLFGTAGALGAGIGSVLLGGLSIPLVALYTVVSAASGAIIGHEFDKSDAKNSTNDVIKNTKKT